MTSRATSYSATVDVTAGTHTVVVEYYEAYGNASMLASYTGPSATPAGTNLISNKDLAAGTSPPSCFVQDSWGTRTVTAAPSTDIPAGATGRSWRIEQSGYVSGDDKLLPSDQAGCVGNLDATGTYTLAVSYKTTTARSSLPLFVYTAGTGWSYWTTLTTLPGAAVWTRVNKAVPTPPPGTTRMSVGVAGEGNRILYTTGYSLVRDTPATATLATAGRWTTAAVTLPVRSIHSTLLRDGRVLLIAGSGNDPNAFVAGSFKSSIWNPMTGSFTDVPTPIDVFCAGHVTLPDEPVLIAGGQRHTRTSTAPACTAGQSPPSFSTPRPTRSLGSTTASRGTDTPP